MKASTFSGGQRAVSIAAGKAVLEGNLALPAHAVGIIVFAHGTGSSRQSPRNRFVAEHLNARGLGTLLVDLLSSEEEKADERTNGYRFNIDLLAKRLVVATRWLQQDEETRHLKIGYFGASTGAAAALVAAADNPSDVHAIVSRGGRPDLAGDSLAKVQAPTLLIVGGEDRQVLALNQKALEEILVAKELIIIPWATHLFEEPGALEEVATFAGQWFSCYLAAEHVALPQ